VKRSGDHPAHRLPSDSNLDDARLAAAKCRACDLWKTATQTVFGEGRASATVVLVGEQPGDQEDRAGHPFVGPAGQVLQDALRTVGLKPDRVYLTNAVKHFKWTARGKRRIHSKPRTSEILACRPWLVVELSMVNAQAVVCLGATAARSVLGRSVTIGKVRGRPLQSPLAPLVFVTTHPSSILRAPDPESRAAARAAFIGDLERVVAALKRAT
jgi:uracil-DNA glycosylase